MLPPVCGCCFSPWMFAWSICHSSDAGSPDSEAACPASAASCNSLPTVSALEGDAAFCLDGAVITPLVDSGTVSVSVLGFCCDCSRPGLLLLLFSLQVAESCRDHAGLRFQHCCPLTGWPSPAHPRRKFLHMGVPDLDFLSLPQLPPSMPFFPAPPRAFPTQPEQ